MVTSQCLRCGHEFEGPAPRAFCPACLPLAATEMAEMRALTLTRYYAEHPDAPMPGDTVRRRTGGDRAFARDVMADLDTL